MNAFFDALISTGASHTYKPDPRAYRLGLDRLRLPKEDILFAAFGGWDAVGAKSFGYPTFWVNRFNQPFEEFGVRPDGTSANLDGLLKYVLPNSPALVSSRSIGSKEYSLARCYFVTEYHQQTNKLGVKDMKRAIFGACCAVALTAVVSAQGKRMAMDKIDHMSMEKVYSGCLERSETGSYSLTHLMAAETKKAMKKDDAMARDAMPKDAMPKDMMAKDTMAPTSLSLAAAGKDFSKYVGHKVTVTGHGGSMNGMATFDVKSLKTIGASCS